MSDRERQNMSRGGAERGGDTESEAGSRLWAVSTEPNVELELTNCEIMTWAEAGRLTIWATQVPQACDSWSQGCEFKPHIRHGAYLNWSKIGATGWLSQLSVQHDLEVRDFEPHVGLCADSLETGACFRFCVSLSLCPSPIRALSVFQKWINVKKKFF